MYYPDPGQYILTTDIGYRSRLSTLGYFRRVNNLASPTIIMWQGNADQRIRRTIITFAAVRLREDKTHESSMHAPCTARTSSDRDGALLSPLNTHRYAEADFGMRAT